MTASGGTRSTSVPRNKRIIRKLTLLGPIIMASAGAFGPGSLVASAAAGAELGYGIIWIVLASGLIGYIYFDMAVRLGMALPDTALQTINKITRIPVGSVVGLCYVLAGILFMAGSILGTTMGLSLLFGGQTWWWAVAVTIGTLALGWNPRPFKSLKFVMIGLVAIMLVVFIVTAFLTQPDWSGVGWGLIPNRIPGETLVAFSLLSTSVAMHPAFYAVYTTREKGNPKDLYRDTTRIDTITGAAIQPVLGAVIIIAAATVLTSGNIASPADLAKILGPTVGPAAVSVFALGIFAAGFSSVIANFHAGGAVLGDSLNLGSKLQLFRVKASGSLVLLLGLAITLIFGEAPVQLVVLLNALVIFVLPALALSILALCNSKHRMGNLANKWWHNVLAVIGLALVLLSAVRTAMTLFS